MSMRNGDFCAFILTHGRPDKVYTYDSLRKAGYTGKVYIVIDDEDSEGDAYRARFGDAVLTFCKEDIARAIDEGDNFNNRKAILYARNACFALAKQVGCTHFLQLDDDYISWEYRINEKGEYDSDKPIKNLDAIIDGLLDYYKNIPALSIAIAQSGDFAGGKMGKARSPRKCMNTFICSTDRPFKFFGRLNEDVNVYTNLGRRGALFLTIHSLMIKQQQTQQNSGGMTETYLTTGTYVKSFYSVMYSPSCVRITSLPSDHSRIHHMVRWRNAAPMIIDQRHRSSRVEQQQ